MQRIARYAPPTAADLAGLKQHLNFTSPQMSDLAGLAEGQWRRYTGGEKPRELSLQMHFYMAALLTLGGDELARVVDKMREHGAEVDLGPLPAGPRSRDHL